jgi:hypothetical protein
LIRSLVSGAQTAATGLEFFGARTGTHRNGLLLGTVALFEKLVLVWAFLDLAMMCARTIFPCRVTEHYLATNIA